MSAKTSKRERLEAKYTKLLALRDNAKRRLDAKERELIAVANELSALLKLENGATLVERYRTNDYVGPAIWGFRVPPGLKVGDIVYWEEPRWCPGKRWFGVVGITDGRRAIHEDPDKLPKRVNGSPFQGFITHEQAALRSLTGGAAKPQS